MQIPKESLEDFMTGMPVDPKPAEPPPGPRPVSFSGQVELLKPIEFSEDLVKSPVEILVPLVPSRPAARTHWFSGFYRSLAVAGSFAIIALVLASGIFFGTYRPAAEPATSPGDLGLDQQPEGILTTPDNPDLTGPTAPTSLLLISDEPRALPHVRRPGSARVLRAAYHPRRVVRPHQMMVTGFVPTTLVIYAENGEIKTRIEPQLTSGYKKQLVLPTN
jgi:hypothetical protein